MSNPTFTPDEQAFTNQVLALADPKKLGIIPGDVAVSLFAGSNIPADTLGDIWQIADSENNGFLTRKGLSLALRLMSHVQFGEKVDESLINKPAPPPTIKGITPLPTKSSTPVSGQRSVPSTPTPRPVPPVPARPSTIYTPAFPPLTAEDRAKFTRIFAQSGPAAGLLSGEKARDVFLKSKLPVDMLGQIWALADTQSRGALDLTDFILGMYFIQSTMNKSLPTLPATLPPELYEQASGGRTRVASPAPISPISRQATGQQPVATHATGGSFHGAPSPGFISQFPPASPVTVQRTGSISRLTAVPTGSSIASPWGGQHQPAAAAWDISSAEKATFDRFFATLDKANAGYITGDIAVPFMLESKLPESTLAQIWDLADLDNIGQLDRDGFAVAMHLINGQLAGKELPSTLPASLIPPSKRAPVPVQAPSRPVDDLFSLFDDPPVSQATPPAAVSPPRVSVPRQIPPTAPVVQQPLQDLLGDDDVAAPPPNVPDRSAEVGNLQNQLNSTQRSVEKSKAERAPLEKQVVEYAAQIAQLESQLAAAKAAHDAETQLLSNVRTRSAEQNEQIRKLKEDLIRAESDLSALRLEKTEIETALLRDKEDVRDMQRKMKALGDDTDKVKAELDKAKNDARLQKGLVAIAKKQLATAEAAKAKALEELEATQAEIQEAQKQTKEAEDAAAATLASIPEPPSAMIAEAAPQVLSPSMEKPMAIPLPETPEPGATPGTMSPKSNNPFERLTRGLSSGASTPRNTGAVLPAIMPVPNDVHDAQGHDDSLPAPASDVAQEMPIPEKESLEMPFATSTDASKEDPFGPAGGEEPTSPAPLAETGSSFDDIFGPGPTADLPSDAHDVPASAEDLPAEVAPGHPADSIDPQQGEDVDDLKEAEDHFPPLAASPLDEDLPPLREVEEAEDDSSDDEFHSPPETARSAPDGPPASVTAASAPSVEGTMITATLHEPTTVEHESPPSEDIATPKAVEVTSVSSAPPAMEDDFFGSGFVPSTITAGSTSGHSAALDDFDEAMGQMPATDAAVGAFQFDSAFGRSFGAPPNGPSDQAPFLGAPVNGATIRAVNGSGAPSSANRGPTAAGDDFDSIFPDTGLNGSAVTQTSTAPSLSFDDAFVVPAIGTPQPTRAESTRSIFAANMASPMTPPRKTASKNKGLILNPNMPAVFHSELAPPTQRNEGATTPALPDDVDAVKQLCGMGFTRSQAVAALEKYGYDVSKALNSLLR